MNTHARVFDLPDWLDWREDEPDLPDLDSFPVASNESGYLWVHEGITTKRPHGLIAILTEAGIKLWIHPRCYQKIQSLTGRYPLGGWLPVTEVATEPPDQELR